MEENKSKLDELCQLLVKNRDEKLREPGLMGNIKQRFSSFRAKTN